MCNITNGHNRKKLLIKHKKTIILGRLIGNTLLNFHKF